MKQGNLASVIKFEGNSFLDLTASLNGFCIFFSFYSFVVKGVSKSKQHGSILELIYTISQIFNDNGKILGMGKSGVQSGPSFGVFLSEPTLYMPRCFFRLSCHFHLSSL